MAKFKNSSLALWLGLAAIIVLLDQISKITVERIFVYAERKNVISGFFDLTLHYNRGAAFSFLSNEGGWQRWFFTALGVAACVFIVYLLAKHGSQKLFALALTLIMGGAAGNVIDRVAYGHVIDFISVYHHPWYFPIFNLADAAISLGAALFVLDELLRVRRER